MTKEEERFASEEARARPPKAAQKIFKCFKTSKEISDLEGELSSIKNLLSTQAALIHGLVEGVNVDSLSIFNSNGSSINATSDSEDKEISDLDKWLIEFPNLLDVLLAERRVDEALAALDEGEHVVSEAKEMKSLNPCLLLSLQHSISEHRQKLAD
ncbi:hypothetical protein RJT34_12167 [Clitoria ternatea]|uniref:Uncharacterized protein n=1 Tax=Clitoria ternatea TaxID=43366 RepID=A0AAN9JNF1_CLITE